MEHWNKRNPNPYTQCQSKFIIIKFHLNFVIVVGCTMCVCSWIFTFFCLLKHPSHKSLFDFTSFFFLIITLPNFIECSFQCFHVHRRAVYLFLVPYIHHSSMFSVHIRLGIPKRSACLHSFHEYRRILFSDLFHFI